MQKPGSLVPSTSDFDVAYRDVPSAVVDLEVVNIVEQQPKNYQNREISTKIGVTFTSIREIEIIQ